MRLRDKQRKCNKTIIRKCEKEIGREMTAREREKEKKTISDVYNV